MLKIMLYAYHEGKDVSSRSIEKKCRRDINYMFLLEGRPTSDHAAIARFRTKHFAKCSQQFLSQMTVGLPDSYVVEKKMYWQNTYYMPWHIILDGYIVEYKKYKGQLT